MNEVYVIMCQSEVFENRFFIDETKASQRVKGLNKETNSEKFWYKRLFKLDA